MDANWKLLKTKISYDKIIKVTINRMNLKIGKRGGVEKHKNKIKKKLKTKQKIPRMLNIKPCV